MQLLRHATLHSQTVERVIFIIPTSTSWFTWFVVISVIQNSKIRARWKVLLCQISLIEFILFYLLTFTIEILLFTRVSLLAPSVFNLYFRKKCCWRQDELSVYRKEDNSARVWFEMLIPIDSSNFEIIYCFSRLHSQYSASVCLRQTEVEVADP